MPVIVISGKPGCGSSTVAKLLAKKLKLKHFSVGDYNKSHSKAKKETDKSIEVWKTNTGSSKKFHLDSDKLAAKTARKGNVVIDGKIGVKMLKGYYDFSVWLKAGKGIRAKRYAKRDNSTFGWALKKLNEKERLERSNWKQIYGFDYFSQEKEADVVVNTVNKTPEHIVDLIISKVRRVFIVHRWNARPRSDWYPYVKQHLENKRYLVSVLKMPDTNKPQLSRWLPFLAKAVGTPTENTFLVGHSAGVATILHYLESLKNGKKIGGCILVAGWTDDLGYKQLTNFVDRPFNWAKIRRHCRKFVVIDSDTDPYVKLYHGKTFQRNLKAKLITEHSKGHLDDDSKIKKLPSVIEAVEGMVK